MTTAAQGHLPGPADPHPISSLTRAQWMVLVAAFLGWLFDGFEIGLFPVVARPALLDLLQTTQDARVGPWMAGITACFLMGAACGGLVFGWLGDRIGRVRALALSILAYSLFTGFSYFAQAPWHLGVLRFIGALGMGGEWSLGVALVMECWPERWRPALAGAIGAAANFGFLLTGAVGKLFVITIDSWRWMFLVGAAPALLVFFIMALVPESERWRQAVQHQAARPVREVFSSRLLPTTLLGILLASVALIGTWGSVQWLPLWADQLAQKQAQAQIDSLAAPENPEATPAPAVSASGQRREPPKAEVAAAPWTDQALAARRQELRRWAAQAKANTQMLQAAGAILGCLLAPLLGARMGRRPAYFLLCLASLLLCGAMFRTVDHFGAAFLWASFLVSAATASFYGWFPLYFPEIFPTRVRATGQGLCYNFGRVFAAGGAMVQGQLVAAFGGSYPRAGAVVTLIYLAGMALIWLAPETKDKPLPE